MSKVLFLIIGFKKPSSKKRVLGSIDFLKSKGHEIHVREIPHGFLGQVLMLKELRRHDIVFVQKKLFNIAELRLIRLLSKKLVFDLDDAVMFHELERNEPVRGKYCTRFAATAAICDCVICGNGYLSSYSDAARGGRYGVAVLPTPVDTAVLKPKEYGKAAEGVTIGWIGTKGNLYSLGLIERPLRELAKKYPSLRLKVISSAEPKLSGLPVELKQWSAEEEAADLRSIDIGVMPLLDNLWTRGKGGYKLLQYMAAGVPAVASPVGINCEIIKDGENGFLAKNEGEWYEKLSALVSDAGLRERAGRAGRETVQAEYSLERYNKRLLGLLEGLV